jgi:hypothetical protein
MSVVIESKLMGRGCALERDATKIGFPRTITERYLCRTNDKTARAVCVELYSLVAQGDPVPDMWTTYDVDPRQLVYNTGSGTAGTASDPSIYLLKKRITRLVDDDTEWQHWLVECVWMPPPDDSSGLQPVSLNPLLEPVRYTYEWANYTVQTETYGTGLPAANTAGDAFDPPLERDDSRLVMVALRNYPQDINRLTALGRNYQNTVNSDWFHGQPPGCAKVESITIGALTERNGIQYHPVLFRIQFAADPTGTGTGTGTGTSSTAWQVHRYQRGHQVMETVTVGTGTGTGTAAVTRKVWPRVKTGTAKGEFLDHVNLGADGTQLPDGSAPILTAFGVYPVKAFADLGI